MLWNAKMRFGKTLTALEVVRRKQYKKVIIITHRPVVDAGWSEDFSKIFFKGNTKKSYLYLKKESDSSYIFDKKIDSTNDDKIREYNNNNYHYIYFASLQDLRGSKRIGGNYDKNNAVFDNDWDLIIIDEAHEGTQTDLGSAVIKELRKNKTRVLSLSGTPFNLLNDYKNDNIYTWDYVMEQKSKIEWDQTHFGDHNPYADLPKMNIFTYDLGEKLKKYISDDFDSKAFNFREFFRVWNREIDGNILPENAVEGQFVHQDDILSFLNMLVDETDETGYPFSTQEYRDMFCHTLWMVPGVKEAKALSKLLHQHPVFRHFGIANVAGDGDEKETNDALKLVQNTIKNHDYSITLSCGKLTTGVTVKEWTAVLMLNGSYSTAASQYMQTIFRVQSAGSIDGKQKTNCYVFDFAPDRALKVLANTVKLSKKPGKNQDSQRKALGDFLNFCPVIAVTGSKTREYKVETMMEQIKQIYAEKAVNEGFDDDSIYSDELLKLTDIDATKFNELKDIIGSSKGSKKTDKIIINDQGFTQEELEHLENEEPTNPKEPLSPEEEALREKYKKAKETRRKAINILRGISIRMPLLLYGADVPIDKDISIDEFVEIVDDKSWKEFMPDGVTKKVFKDFTKYYDRDVFIAAGKRIRRLALLADKEKPTQRIKHIAEIFSHFRNPDKETVLTPWRVVNMHMASTIGGWCFFNENFENEEAEKNYILDHPRFVDQGKTTKDLFRKDAHILEINSKSGLYPLYVAYSFYRQRLIDNGLDEASITTEECWHIWKEVINENIYVICKTQMAQSITSRTLCGYQNIKYNSHSFKNLFNQIKNKPNQFITKILNGFYWHKEGNKKMKFDAVVGNPPYQDSMSVNNRQGAIYHHFYDIAGQLSDRYSLISPARFLFNAGLTPKSWNKKMLEDEHFKVVRFEPDARNIFPNTEIKGGIVITYRDTNQEFGKIKNFIPDQQIRKIVEKFDYDEEHNFSSIIFGGRSDLKFNDEFLNKYPRSKSDRLAAIQKEHPNVQNLAKNEEYELKSSTLNVLSYVFLDEEPVITSDYYKILGLVNNKRKWRWISKRYMIPRYPKKNNLNDYKVFISKASGSGQFGEKLSKLIIGGPDTSATPTFLSVGNFN